MAERPSSRLVYNPNQPASRADVDCDQLSPAERRLAERVQPYAPTTYRQTVILAIDPWHPQEHRVALSHRPLMKPVEVAAVIGRRDTLICALVQGGKTFWVVAAGEYATAQLNSESDIITSGVSVVCPHDLRTRPEESNFGERSLYFDSGNRDAGIHLDVGAEVPGVGQYFTLPPDYPKQGFTVTLEANEVGHQEIIVTARSPEQPVAVLQQLTVFQRFLGQTTVLASSQ